MIKLVNMQEKSLLAPVFDISSGVYKKTQVFEIKHKDKDVEIYYNINHSEYDLLYYGAIAINKTSIITAYAKKHGVVSPKVSVELKIEKNKEKRKGPVVIIGGAEHCQEIHKKIIDLAGGPEKAKIAFIPTSSANPYAGGMERMVRFRELGGLIVDEELVPELNGKKDFSSIDNKSNFWIVPIALLDDETTGKDVKDDYDHPLVNESEFPDIDESTWSENGHLKIVAEKLRDDGYNIIFLTGGNQARYLECLLYNDNTETPVLKIIREIFEEKGGVIAGTSAGAAIFSDVMVLGGGSYGAAMSGVIYQDIDLKNFTDNYTPFSDDNDGRLWLGKGFGFLPDNIITGTHFIVRGRAGRLITAVLYLKENKKLPVVGLGVGEDTAVVYYPDNSCEVVGAGGVLILDGSRAVIFEGDPDKGKMHTSGLVMHYIEGQDKFYINDDGKVIINNINQTKQEIKEKYKNGSHYYIEHDIFGSKAFKRFVFDSLVKNEASFCMGLEMIDNTEESYDSILFHDIVKEGSVLFMFSTTKDTKGYEGKIEYHWYGKKDMDYPRLKTEIEDNRFSFTDVFIESIPIKFINFPKLDDARNIPLKRQYLSKGYTEEEWYEIFDREKRFYYGMIIFHEEQSINICTFFFDYAYHDYSGNGRYSPPRYAKTLSDKEFQDYDIVEINVAPDSEIYVNNNLAGKTDEFGLFYLVQNENYDDVMAVYKGKYHDYSVKINLNEVKEKAIMIFSDKSW